MRKKLGLDEDEEAEVEDPGGYFKLYSFILSTRLCSLG